MQTHIDTKNQQAVPASGGDRHTTRRRVAAMLFGCAGATLAGGIAAAQPRIVPRGGNDGAPTAPAGDAPIKVVTLEMMEPLLQGAGFTDVKIEQPANQARYIFARLKGVPLNLRINCSENGCTVMYFVADLGRQDHIDAHYMNAWNRHYALSALYHFGDNALAFRFGAPLGGGVSVANLKSNVALYVGLFNDLLKFKPPAPATS